MDRISGRPRYRNRYLATGYRIFCRAGYFVNRCATQSVSLARRLGMDRISGRARYRIRYLIGYRIFRQIPSRVSSQAGYIFNRRATHSTSVSSTPRLGMDRIFGQVGLCRCAPIAELWIFLRGEGAGGPLGGGGGGALQHNLPPGGRNSTTLIN